MKTTPPPEWRDAVGKAAVAAWHFDQEQGDWFITQSWANPLLRVMAPQDAAAAAVAEENASDAAGLAKLLGDRAIPAHSAWVEDYIREWTWLVVGECDFMNDDGDPWLEELWRERGTEDPRAVAQEHLEEVFDAAKRESYRVRRDELLWRPPVD